MANEPATTTPNGKKRGRKPGTPMSQEHKDALALGRAEGKVVREYLNALVNHKPKRGRKRTSESVERRLNEIENLLGHVEPIDQLRLLQERRDLQVELLTMGAEIDMSGVESEFVEVAANYSHRNNIDYATWREIGVPASVLKAAGVSRGAA